jgi:hypothetical protein
MLGACQLYPILMQKITYQPDIFLDFGLDPLGHARIWVRATN